MPEPSHQLPCDDFGALSAGVAAEAERRACRTVAHHSSSLKEFAEFMDTLGLRPEITYQDFLKER